MTLRIGLIDADLMDNGTRHPNLALMKIAGFYRDSGCEVELIYDDYISVYDFDKVFISKVFNFSKIPDWVLSLDHVSYGGTGFFEDGGENLPYEIEHHMPYYDLYKKYVEKQISIGRNRSNFSDYLDYSIGFSSRGCFRKCEFCVNKKYSHAFLHSPVSEFVDEARPYIYLWDDNILALPKWEDVFDQLEQLKKPFQFRQGLDLRLMTDRKAKRIIESRHQGDFIFAFDHLEDKELIIEKVQLWKRYSSKVCKMYVICAYNSQDEHDIEDVFIRIHTLMTYGSIPYIMRYESYKDSPFRSLYIELARWCNQPNFFKKKSFREFCIANQEYKKNQSTNCSAYQAMLDFESAFPNIAKKYFDLRFDDETIYRNQYGYGRKYANKPLCKDCKKNGVCWESFQNGQISDESILQAYFTKEIDLECLNYQNSECNVQVEKVVEKLVELIINTTTEKIVKLIADSDMREDVSKDNIPQYSKPDDALYAITDILRDCGCPLTFEDAGHYLTRNDPNSIQNPTANKKYGENHAKLSALLDMVKIDKSNGRALISLSTFGKYYCNLDKSLKGEIARKLFLRIPIIQNYFIMGNSFEAIESSLSILSGETVKRRRSNVQNMVRSILEGDEM